MEGRKSTSSGVWPWKKKSQSPSVPPVSKPPSSQTKYSSQDGKQSKVQKERLQRISSDSNIPVREEQTKETDNIIKQHAEVAEEAVVGRKKAQEEVAKYKKQLEEAMKQKQDAELKYKKPLEDAMKQKQEADTKYKKQLEDVLKQKHDAESKYKKQLEELTKQKQDVETEKNKCMQQIKLSNERNDLEMKEALKKSKALESMTVDLESKLSEMEINFVEAKGENSLLHETIREREMVIAELSEEKYKLEEDTQALYVKLNTLFKGNSRLKYELQLFKKERQINSEEIVSRSREIFQISRLNEKIPKRCYSGSTSIADYLEGSSVKEMEDSKSFQSQLEVLRTASMDKISEGDGKDEEDELSCAQSWASAMIAELDHFKKGKSLSQENISYNDTYISDTNSMKEEIALHACTTMYAKEAGSSARFSKCISDIVKLVESMAHPLIVYAGKSTEAQGQGQGHPSSARSELSETDLQMRIDGLKAVRKRVIEIGGGSSVSWHVVDFLEALVVVMNRLVKISLYRNAQNEGCPDEDFDNMSDMSGLASVSQQQSKVHRYAAKENALSLNDLPDNSLGKRFVWNSDEKVMQLQQVKKSLPEKSEIETSSKKKDCSSTLTREEKKSKKALESAKESKKENEVEIVKDGGTTNTISEWKNKDTMKQPIPQPSADSKQLMHKHTPKTSSSAKNFDLSSKYLKTALQSTISKVMSSKPQSSAPRPVLPHKSKSNNKFVNRLLSI